jgi:hypothetical protein
MHLSRYVPVCTLLLAVPSVAGPLLHHAKRVPSASKSTLCALMLLHVIITVFYRTEMSHRGYCPNIRVDLGQYSY